MSEQQIKQKADNLSLLLVEDDEEDAYFFRRHVKQIPSVEWQITHASRLEKLEALAQESSFDMIFLDLELPDSTGLDTFLNARKLFPQTPIAILTGLIDDELAIQAVEQGAQNFITKHNLIPDLIFKTTRFSIERNRILNEIETRTSQLIESKKIGLLGTMVAGIAHDINNPLSVCLTALGDILDRQKKIGALIAKDNLTKSELEEFFSVTTKELDILQRNIFNATDLLTSFRHVISDQTQVEKTQVNMYQFLQDIAASLHPQLCKKQITISIQGAVDLEFLVYPAYLSQVMINLILNSQVHGFSDSSEGTISISYELKEDHILIVYEDNGVGIAPELASSIFEPFVTSNPDKNVHGLGLYMIQTIINEQMDGSILLDPHKKPGVRFTLELPYISQ
jgi:signal transduction histidine kinase